MSCLMLLASLRGLLPSRSLLRVGRFFGATALHTPVVGGQQTADTFGGTTLNGSVVPVNTTGDELRHRSALGQTRRGRGVDRHLSRRLSGLPPRVGCGLPRVRGNASVGAGAVRRGAVSGTDTYSSRAAVPR